MAAARALPVDTRLLSRVPVFTGDEKAWAEWKHQFRAFVLATNMFSAVALQAVDDSMDVIDIAEVPVHKVEDNSNLYYALVLSCKGRASTVLQSCPPGH
eukprot:6468488-Amphidinium_carterae.1